MYLFLSPTLDCEVLCLCLGSIKPKALFVYWAKGYPLGMPNLVLPRSKPTFFAIKL